MLLPSRTKYRKKQKGSLRGLTKGGEFVEFGEYGMQVLERGKVTNRQIEACRVAITRHFSRKGKVWIKIFPDKPITKKPAETRMGKGKGAVDHWVAPVRPGKVLFEVANVSREEAQQALVRAAAKLNLKTRFVERVEKV
ncbi:MAG: 50S ribosomal protein L16 [Rhabdochlamydiaceae bacterium]|nr:50S ribosomal protein L16 [Candidatus Amphrikana amoebophyrae]